MTTASPCTYEITVAGHLDDHWSERLGGLDIVRRRDGTTILTGTLADQAHLHGVLAALRDIGADLLGLRTRAPDAGCTRQDGIAGSAVGRQPPAPGMATEP
jgi:hypothetical protein